MKTIKELADEIGVSKVAINKKLDALGLKTSLTKKGNTFVIDANTEKQIKRAYRYTPDNHINNITDNADNSDDNHGNQSENRVADIIDVLRSELSAKNEQIRSLQETIKEQQETIKEQHATINKQYTLIENSQSLQGYAMTGNTRQPIEVIQPIEVVQPNTAKQGFWSRLFGKDKTPSTPDTDTDA